ncbi:MAG: molybdenum cofactor guanylyltransferase [Acidimicrobiia bacterium]|nr:molybdenum cofactor guanylyltransferase [Acidimicrobiia bacterium]
MERAVGVILAGGKATRMGRDKAQVTFAGRPMIDHVSAALRTAGVEVLVVGRHIADHVSIPDLPNIGGGPAAGLLTALRHLGNRAAFLVAVDQPLLRPETVQAMLELDGDAVVAMAEGHPQVTCAVYRPASTPQLSELVAGGDLKLRRLLDRVATTYVDPETWAAWGEDGRSWLSLDTPQAVRDAEALR